MGVELVPDPSYDPASELVLDTVASLCLSTAELQRFSGALAAMKVWETGMFHQFERVNRLEACIREDAGENAWSSGFVDFSGNRFQGMGVDPASVIFAFQMYAVAACNYAQGVAWIGRATGRLKSSWKDYCNGVLPEVFVYRNKLAAHAAAFDDDRQDNEAERMASLLPVLAMNCGMLCTPAGVVGGEASGEPVSSERMRPWSLTRSHLRLVPRWWPHARPSSPWCAEESESLRS